MTASSQEFEHLVNTALVPQAIDAITSGLPRPDTVVSPLAQHEYDQRDIVFHGDLDAVLEYFHEHQWSDGLPIVPPTLDRVCKFLQFTDDAPDRVIGILPPEHRVATVWNVAVNGVMAGCRPEYMPILIAVAEILSDPRFRLEDAGSTPGWETIVILNGPVTRELNFNSGTGVLRVGRQANTSVGRFVRLFMTNVGGLRIPPGNTDKGTIGQSFLVALAEDELAVMECGWPSFGADCGFNNNEDVVTLQSVISVSPPMYSAGTSAAAHVETLARIWGYGDCAYWAFNGIYQNAFYPLLVMSPAVAKAISSDGWSKSHVRDYLYQNVMVPAQSFEFYARQAAHSSYSVAALVEQGIAGPEYMQSSDPDRLIPVFPKAEWIGIVVAGDSGRNQSRGYVNNHRQGLRLSRRARKPAAWNDLLASRPKA